VTRAFVGRERERAELLTGLRDTVDGHGRLFLIAGGAGVGKTALAQRCATDAEERGLRVLWGRCWEGGGAPPYWPWMQIIQTLADACDDDTLRSHLGAGSSHVTRMVPALTQRLGAPAARVPSHGSDAARFYLFEATARFLRRAASAEPLMLVLDDLHVADAASLLLLRFLTRDVGGSRLLVVGTFRAVDAARRLDAVDTLADLARVGHVLSLAALGRDDVTALVADLAGTVPQEQAVAAIYDTTEGNPLFVREVVRLIASREALDRAGQARVPIPETVRAVIRQRLVPLSANAVQVASAAAVVGRDFDLPLVAAACDLPTDAVLSALSDAMTLGVVTEEPDRAGVYRFTHHLMRTVIYEQLPLPARMQLHHRVGTAIENLVGADSGPHLPELAHHFSQVADPDAAAKAVAYARGAGDRAMLTHAYEHAAAEYRRALRALPAAGHGEVLRCELHLRLGDALARAGSYRDAKAVYLRAADMARTIDSPARLAHAALGYGEPRVEGALVDRQLITLLKEALERLSPHDDPLRVRLLARLSLEHTFSETPTLRDTLSQQAVTIARQLHNGRVLGTALQARWAALWGPDRLDERTAVADEIVHLARDAGDRELELVGLVRRIACAVESGQIRTAAADIAAHARAADELRMPVHQSAAATMRAMLTVLRGSFDEAQQLADHALSLQAARATAQFAHLYTNGLIHWEQGRLGGLREHWQRLVDQFPNVNLARAWLSVAQAEDGREDEARINLRSVVDGIPQLPSDGLWLPTFAVAALAAAQLDDPDAAGSLYPPLEPYAERVITFAVPEPVICLGALSHSLALLATTQSQYDDAERHFQTALRAHDQAGARTLLANTRYEYGRMLIRRGRSGDRKRAARLLDQAVTAARETGMARVAGEVQRLRDLTAGATASAASSGDPSGTPQVEADCVFRREGDYWTITYDGDLVRLRDSKGLAYLARLLATPGQELHAVDLEIAEGQRGRPRSDRTTAQARSAELSVHRDLGDAGELLDAAAKAAYKARLDDLQAELDEAERFNDPARAARLAHEKDFLVAELARAVGLGGRDRKAASHAERARLNVTRAIRSALANLSRANPALGEHLSSTIHTGRYCSYTPDPRAPIDWVL
jgi:tetratricopeptide (TPR) repeat protein